ncbi:hypothetical protein JW935_02260 [candidate division KSB1 bacterium]|nr:hypothetical protein [candidate division KSB1 bacterium]
MPPDIISFNSGDAPGGPIPKSDTFYYTPWIYKSLSFNIKALAIASGIAWMVFYIIIALIRGDTISRLYPVISESATTNILVGIPCSFVLGLIVGIILGVIYNHCIYSESHGYNTFG